MRTCENDGNKVIHQLTLKVKAVFCLIIFVPRTIINGYLLWLGCRWLMATANFDNLVLNSVALAFILDLSQIFYAAMVPVRSKHDLSVSRMLPLQDKSAVGYRQMLFVAFVNGASLLWTAFYMVYFQAVLPDYRWDVRKPCMGYLASILAV